MTYARVIAVLHSASQKQKSRKLARDLRFEDFDHWVGVVFVFLVVGDAGVDGGVDGDGKGDGEDEPERRHKEKLGEVGEYDEQSWRWPRFNVVHRVSRDMNCAILA